MALFGREHGGELVGGKHWEWFKGERWSGFNKNKYIYISRVGSTCAELTRTAANTSIITPQFGVKRRVDCAQIRCMSVS